MYVGLQIKCMLVLYCFYQNRNASRNLWNFTKPPGGSRCCSMRTDVRKDEHHEATGQFVNARQNTDTKCLDGRSAELGYQMHLFVWDLTPLPPAFKWIVEISTNPLCTHRGSTWKLVYTELTPRYLVDLIRELNHFLQNSDWCFYFPGFPEASQIRCGMIFTVAALSLAYTRCKAFYADYVTVGLLLHYFNDCVSNTDAG
jgi:hypothetical protein